MDMEAMMSSEELVVASCNNDATNIAKGKRTKRRLRPLSPYAVVAATTITAVTTTAAMTSSCSSASGGGGSLSSTTSEEEEEDMANCLILLAQGRGGRDPHHHKELCGEVKTEKSSTKNVDFYVYECKTCNRTFPSFQALGGHRASHKKPKLDEKKSSSSLSPSPPSSLLPPPPASSQLFNFEEAKESNMKIVTPSVSLQLGCGNTRGGLNFHGNKSKIHECSICGAEFTSGQALGGHMRRHRASTNNNIIVNNSNNIVQTTTNSDDGVQVKARNVLELDLNLPAPEDDLRDSKFQFPANKNSMMLSAAPALVGCHY